MAARDADMTSTPKAHRTLQSSVYSVDAIKRAAYVMLGRATVTVEHDGDEIHCTFEFPDGASNDAVDEIQREFVDEVLDQDLRERVRSETSSVRNAILAQAFSRTGLQE